MADLLHPEEREFTTQSGEVRTYVLSKFPAIAGREIIAGYPLTGLPKIGEYKANEEIMLKLMSFVAVRAGDTTVRLSTRALVENHVPEWETLARIEMAMLEMNCSFFANGRASTFLAGIAQKGQALLIETLTGLSAQLSKAAKQPSKN